MLHAILEKFERAFNRLILILVTITIARATIKTYVEVRELTWEYRYGFSSKVVVNETLVPDAADTWETVKSVASTTHCIIETILNAAWTVGFLVPCVYCNEMVSECHAQLALSRAFSLVLQSRFSRTDSSTTTLSRWYVFPSSDNTCWSV